VVSCTNSVSLALRCPFTRALGMCLGGGACWAAYRANAAAACLRVAAWPPLPTSVRRGFPLGLPAIALVLTPWPAQSKPPPPPATRRNRPDLRASISAASCSASSEGRLQLSQVPPACRIMAATRRSVLLSSEVRSSNRAISESCLASSRKAVLLSTRPISAN